MQGMKEEFDARFTSVPHYPNMLHFSKPFEALKNSTWQGKEIREMVRSLGAVYAPLLSSDMPEKTPLEWASEIEVMKTIQALVKFALLSWLRAHSLISLKYLVEALEWYYRCCHRLYLGGWEARVVALVMWFMGLCSDDPMLLFYAGTDMFLYVFLYMFLYYPIYATLCHFWFIVSLLWL